MKQVYLAGPITGMTYKDCTDWRTIAKNSFADSGIKAFTPLRAKEYLDGLGVLSGTGEEYAHLGVFSTPQGIVARDYHDCTTCDVLLVNMLGAKIVSIGTMFEMAWAYMKRTPIVLIMEANGNPNEHIFTRQATGFRVETLEHGIDVVKSILL